MRFVRFLLRLIKKNEPKTLAEYQQEMYVKWGRKQFKKLNELGLNIPVRLA